MRQTTVSIFTLFGCVAASVSIVACGKKDKGTGSGTSSKIRYAGKVGTGFSLTGALTDPRSIRQLAQPLLAADTDVDTLAAFTMSKNEPHFAYEAYPPTSIDGAGSFAFEIDPAGSSDVVLVLVNSKASKPIDRVVGYVGFSDPTVTANLIKLPVPKTEGTQVDVGTQQKGADGTVSSDKKIDEVSSKFSVDAKVLKEVAKTNDSLRNVKNIYANTDTSTGRYYKIGTAHYFDKSLTAADANSWISIDGTAYSGLNFNVRTNNPDVNATSLCTLKTDAAHKSYALVPPSPVGLVNRAVRPHVTTTVSEVNNDGFVAADISSGSCGNSAFYTYKSGANQPNNVTFASGGIDASTIPEGNWTLKFDGAQVAEFDVSIVKPLTADKKILGYVPSFQISVDASNVVTKVEVKLHLWNAQTAAYEEVTDLSTFAAQAQWPSVAIMSNAGKGGSGNRYTESFQGSTDVNAGADDWKKSIVGASLVLTPKEKFLFKSGTNTDATAYLADNILFQYTSNGVQMFYSLKSP